jgi:hypothetical protein
MISLRSSYRAGPTAYASQAPNMGPDADLSSVSSPAHPCWLRALLRSFQRGSNLIAGGQGQWAQSDTKCNCLSCRPRWGTPLAGQHLGEYTWCRSSRVARTSSRVVGVQGRLPCVTDLLSRPVVLRRKIHWPHFQTSNPKVDPARLPRLSFRIDVHVMAPILLPARSTCAHSAFLAPPSR